MEYLESILTIVAGLVGFPALLAAVINVLKYFGWLENGSAPAASMIGHLIAYVAVGVAALLGKIDLVPGIDVQLGLFANILIAVLAFLSSLGLAGKIHEDVLFGLPVIGYSHTERAFELLIYDDTEEGPKG